MGTEINAKIGRLSPEHQAEVLAGADAIVRRQMALRDLRRAMAKTQTAVARKLGIGQVAVSRIEQRSDLLLSTLRDYLHAIGGRLDVVAVLPGHGPVRIEGLGEIARQAAAKLPKKPTARPRPKAASAA